MILTLHVPGTTVKRVQDSLKVYIPALLNSRSSSKSRVDLSSESDDGGSKVTVEDGTREQKTEGDDGNAVTITGVDTGQPDQADQPGQIGQTSGEADGTTGDNQPAEATVVNDPLPKPTSFQVAINQLSSVIVSGNVSITIPVLQHLARCAVPVIFTDKNKPVAILNPFANHGSVRVRKEQFAAIDGERGFSISKQIVGGTLENKARLLLGLAKNRAATNPDVEKQLRYCAQLIRNGKEKLGVLRYKDDPISNRFNLLGIEGDGTKVYFAALKDVIPTAFNFSGRNRRPPRDPVNAMLSLGYTILQGYISIGIAAVGLEPFAGFMHADRAGKPSLSLDLMEEFRQPVVDRLIVALATRGGIKPSHFISTTTGTLLTDQGRDIFVTRLVRRVAPLRPNEDASVPASVNYYKDIIKQARDLSRFLLGLEKVYNPFVMSW